MLGWGLRAIDRQLLYSAAWLDDELGPQPRAVGVCAPRLVILAAKGGTGSTPRPPASEVASTVTRLDCR